MLNLFNFSVHENVFLRNKNDVLISCPDLDTKLKFFLQIHFNTIRPVRKVSPRRRFGSSLSIFNARIFQNLMWWKKYMCSSENFGKIVFLIIKNHIFRNTWVIYAIFLDLIALFSRKIQFFFVHGKCFDPQNHHLEHLSEHNSISNLKNWFRSFRLPLAVRLIFHVIPKR